MDFDHIIKFSPKELYEKAHTFEQSNEEIFWFYMIMSANYGYESAKNYLDEYRIRFWLLKDHKVSNTEIYNNSVCCLAQMYYNGYCIPININKALELYEIAINNGSDVAMGILLHTYINNHHPINDEIIKLFECSIENNNYNTKLIDVLADAYFLTPP